MGGSRPQSVLWGGGGTWGTVFGGGDHSARSAITSLYSTPPPHTGGPSGVHPSSPKALKKDVGGGGDNRDTTPSFQSPAGLSEQRGQLTALTATPPAPPRPLPPPLLCPLPVPPVRGGTTRRHQRLRRHRSHRRGTTAAGLCRESSTA